ncbi:uncharacterized protein Dwil_GK15329 [Drosophila willistoni]|uniref:Sex-regulated protein janus-B n=2 Tax=Drosophila willistoni TaxID=7260 RepID=B4MUK7_DROWI|nr:uncharacterized protein Dwil_GK15329 [Drosophila willistoni]
MMCASRLYCDKQVRDLTNFPLIKMSEGKFKYIMAQVYIHGAMASAREVIRGSSSQKYHIDIYDTLRKEAKQYDLCTQCTGGGYIVHDSQNKYLKIYGRSQAMGKADHEKTREILSEKYPGYKIDAEPGDFEE